MSQWDHIVAPADPVLHLLVELANADNLRGLPLLLTVGGSSILGELIGAREYGLLFGEAVGDRFSTEGGEAVARQIGGTIPETPGYVNGLIHLRDARVILSDSSVFEIPPPGLWRGRLAAIAGWSAYAPVSQEP